MRVHVVGQGDCISSIAESYGLFWETIWNHAQNAELKRNRQDPNVLAPGDEVFLPEKEPKEEPCAVDLRHRFKKKGVPAKLRMKILKRPSEEGAEDSQQARRSGTDADPVYEQPEQHEEFREEPWANCRYLLEIDGKTSNGTTNGGGFVEASISPTAQRGRLTMSPGRPDEMIIELQLGALDPSAEVSGVKQRLVNLGFGCGDSSSEVTDDFREAVRLFQECYELDISGEVDEATRNKLNELYGQGS